MTTLTSDVATARSPAAATVDEPLAPFGTRIQSLDVLRGLALLGMLIVHFHDHSLEPGGLDDAVRTAIWRLVEGKSHGTFAMLFGAGFAIQLRRAESRGAPFVRIYLRRIAALAVFGFIAHACFGFNVLLGYAAWAVPLLLIRRWSSGALIAAAVFSTVSVAAYHVVLGPFDVATARSVNAAVAAAEAQESYAVLFNARLHHMAWFYRQSFFVMPGVTLALFIVGMLAVRHRVLEDPRAHTRIILPMMAFGLFSWIAANWLLPESANVGLVRDQWLMFTYAGSVLLLLAQREEPPSWLTPVAAAGRMALTNYLVQIAVLDLLFSGYALHIGEIRPRFGPPSAFLMFAAQAAFSVAWLARYRLGPAEWIWRSVTYGKMQPIARQG